MTEQKNPDSTQSPSMNFEAAMEQLQATVKRLESGELSLEEALQSFEEGVKLSRLCQQQLNVAEQRVEILMRATQDGQVETQPFSTTRG